MDREQRARRQHRALHTLLAALGDEVREVREVLELKLVLGALGADGQWRTHLRDDHTDLAGRDLHPRELLHAEDRPELEPKPRREELGLISGLTMERDRVVLRQFLA